MDHLLIIAGSGLFPREIATACLSADIPVSVIAIKNECETQSFNPNIKIHSVRVGELGKMLRIAKNSKASHVCFAGGIQKPSILATLSSVDMKGLSLLKKLSSTHDDNVLRAVASEFELIGLEVVAGSRLLPTWVPEGGLLTLRSATKQEMSDGRLGWRMLSEISSHDIGQLLVVAKGSITAIECVEGSDKTIERGLLLGGNSGVVVKKSKPHQDLRFDMPTIGPGTIATMHKFGGSLLIIEASRSIIIDPEETIRSANANAITVFAIHNEEDLHD